MKHERHEGTGPNYFDFEVEKIANEARLNPGKSPYIFLARHFGLKGRKKLEEINKIIVKRGLAGEFLYPGSASFLVLDPLEKEEFLAGFGAVGLDAVLETLFDAKTTLSFNYQNFASIYNKGIGETSVLPIDEVQISPQRISPLKLASFFGRNPSGEFVFSGEGIVIVPKLEPFLNELRILDPIRSRTRPAWMRFTDALRRELQSEKPLSITQVTNIARNKPVPGEIRDGSSLTAEQLRQSETIWRDLLSKPPKGPNN